MVLYFFCGSYLDIQIEWFTSGLLSFAWSQGSPLIIALILTVIYYLALSLIKGVEGVGINLLRYYIIFFNIFIEMDCNYL